MMEVNVLLASNARNILKEFATLKSQKNNEYWTAVKLGLPLPTPKDNFAYNKFMGMIQGTNVKLNKNKSFLSFAPMTDKDVLAISNGELKNPKQVKSKDLMPEQEGLFDFNKTGGTGGTKWSHISLHEPVANPVFAESARRLLGYATQAEFDKQVVIHGGAWLRKELEKLNLDKLESEINAKILDLKGAELSDAVKKLKYIRVLRDNKVRPEDAYVISKIPVLPPTMRPIQASQTTGAVIPAGANLLYRDMMLLNDALKSSKAAKLPPSASLSSAMSNPFTEP